MAFGISFVDIELLIRLSQQNQAAESEPVSLDASILPPAIISVLPETTSIADSFAAKNSETNIVAALTENIPPVSLAANAGAEKSTKNQAEENDKVADIVFNLTSETKASNIKPAPTSPSPAAAVTNNFSGAQTLKQNRLDAEILFRSLLEKFRASVVYDYEMSDAVHLEENAERKHKPLENPSRFADLNQNRKAMQEKENLRREDLKNENQSDESKKRELLKKIQEANKFL